VAAHIFQAEEALRVSLQHRHRCRTSRQQCCCWR
jgi:hypothetical protein